MPPWLAAEHVAMAVDYGYERPSNTLPPTPMAYPGP
jgi:hypothetical protein